MNGESSNSPLAGPEVDDLRRLVARGRIDAFAQVDPRRLTLGGAVELACAWHEWERATLVGPVSVVARWADQNELLGRARRALEGDEDAVEDYAAPTVEIRRTPSYREVAEPSWSLFAQRYRRALVQHGGFSKELADALTGALQEMVDNAVQHSGPSPRAPAQGAVAYEVTRHWMTFVVADLGQGVLASLRRNPACCRLRTSAEALHAAVCEHATSRIGMVQGDGFRQVFRAIADLRGALRFRSGDAVLQVRGLPTAREAVQRGSPPFPGFQLSVSCSFSDT